MPVKIFRGCENVGADSVVICQLIWGSFFEKIEGLGVGACEWGRPSLVEVALHLRRYPVELSPILLLVSIFIFSSTSLKLLCSQE
jgi:hypothetical protein